MSRPLKIIGGLVALVLVLMAGLYGYRSLMLYEGRTPEGYQLLTPMPGTEGFEPKQLPPGPTLANESASTFAVNFGYKVGNIPYSYSLALSFPDSSTSGHATVTARHANRDASVEASTVRRWDEPRKAYTVALQDRFDIEPPVPALCIKAVIGPQTNSYDLKDASICVAQRDAGGNCHAETLACGLIR